jgi:hypothetical protein
VVGITTHHPFITDENIKDLGGLSSFIVWSSEEIFV